MKKKEFAARIDQALLKPAVTFDNLVHFVEENKDRGFYSLCVPSFFVKRAKEIVKNSCKISTVVGFPHGNTSSDVKVYEATQAVTDGASCVDVVLNLSAIKSGNSGYLRNELEALRYSVDMYGTCELRIIIETCLLTEKEKLIVTQLIVDTGCDAVKTSTGFSNSGATVEDVMLLKQVTAGKIKIKAAGGIHDFATAVALLEAGADLIGTSSGLQLLASSYDE